MSPDLLLPGDVLLYRGTGVFSRLIRIKTWSSISHCSIYDGHHFSVASRDGQGVGRYPLRTEGLAMVLRPRDPFNVRAAREWFNTVDGQKYDLLGLLAFFIAKRQGRENGRMFCSEMAVRYLRAGGVEPFTPETDADAVAPGEFAKSPAFVRMWEAG